MQTQVLLYKSGVEGGQNYIGMFTWYGDLERATPTLPHASGEK